MIMVIVILKCVCVRGKPGGGQGESQGSEATGEVRGGSNVRNLT